MCGPGPEEWTDGKSVSRMHTLRATRNEHDWTCTVPWHVFLLCVKTLQMTMTLMREGETMKQSGSTCPVTVVLSMQATHAPRLKTQGYRDVRGSDQTSLVPEVSRRTPGSRSCQERLHGT